MSRLRSWWWWIVWRVRCELAYVHCLRKRFYTWYEIDVAEMRARGCRILPRDEHESRADYRRRQKALATLWRDLTTPPAQK